LSNEELLVVATLGGAEFARLGSVQPIRQAKTAIHREITVATAERKVRNGEGIIQSVYLAIRKDNLICAAGGGGSWRSEDRRYKVNGDDIGNSKSEEAGETPASPFEHAAGRPSIGGQVDSHFATPLHSLRCLRYCTSPPSWASLSC